VSGAGRAVAVAATPPAVWLHAPVAEGLLRPVTQMLSEALPQAQIHATGGAGLREVPDARALAELLDQTGPRVAVVLGSPLPEGVLDLCARRGVPLLMAGASAAMVPHDPARQRAGGWHRAAGFWSRLIGRSHPPPSSPVIAALHHVLVTDLEAETAFLDAGLAPGSISLTGPLEDRSPVPPANEAERAALAAFLGTRPAWLALGLPEAEDDLVIAAHLSALRGAHRLLLVIVPDDPARGAALARRLVEQGELAIARRGADEDPGPETQVYIADTEGEDGLWLRLAPTVWMGGSATAGSLRPPFAAAGLGAVVVHGGVPGAHGAELARLDAAGATWVARDAAALGAAVSDLLAPDLSARMAAAAWDVTSAGADTTRRLAALVVGCVARAG
jgi:3-deoxy-D-manno-octulosonic-acid transferase